MGFRTLKMQPITYNANGVFPVNINQAGNLCELVLNLNGSLTIGTPGTNNIRANIGRGDEWAVIQRLDLIANGQEVIQSYTGPQLVETARRDYAVHPRRNIKLGDTYSGTVAFESVLPLPIWTPGAKRPIDTALQTGKFQTLRAQVQWADASAIASASGSFGTNPQLNLTGLYNTDEFVPPYLKKVFRTTLSPTGSQTNARVDLPVGPAYHRLLVNITSSGSDDSTKLNNVRLVSGSTVFWDSDDFSMREVARFRSETPNSHEDITALTTTAVAGTVDGALQDETASYAEAATENNIIEITEKIQQISRVHRSSKSDLNAWYDLNLAPDGSLEQAIQTVIGGRALSEFFLEFDVSGACTIDVFSQVITANPFAE
jgi:hypothetical protein